MWGRYEWENYALGVATFSSLGEDVPRSVLIKNRTRSRWEEDRRPGQWGWALSKAARLPSPLLLLTTHDDNTKSDHPKFRSKHWTDWGKFALGSICQSVLGWFFFRWLFYFRATTFSLSATNFAQIPCVTRDSDEIHYCTESRMRTLAMSNWEFDSFFTNAPDRIPPPRMSCFVYWEHCCTDWLDWISNPMFLLDDDGRSQLFFRMFSQVHWSTREEQPRTVVNHN